MNQENEKMFCTEILTASLSVIAHNGKVKCSATKDDSDMKNISSVDYYTAINIMMPVSSPRDLWGLDSDLKPTCWVIIQMQKPL